MAFKSFRLNVILRLMLLSGLVTTSAWSMAYTEWQVTPFACVALAVLVLIDLIRYVESVNRELASFLQFVAHRDFSVVVPIGEKGRVFRELEGAYSLLAKMYRSLNLEKAANHQYLEALVEHVSSALVCLDEHGTVKLMNRQAAKLFRSPHLQSIRSFKRIDPRLPAVLEELDDGDRTLFEIAEDAEPLQLALFATKFQLLGERYKLVSFHNIRDELEQREMDFSHKLIRVLTHEIMNSVTPIISLSKVIEDVLIRLGTGGPVQELQPHEREDLVRAVASIRSRGSGLLRFVQAYGTLTNLPRPNWARVDVVALLKQVETLMSPALLERNVTLEAQAGEQDVYVRADPEQLQQVLINLVKNAVEALDGRPDARIVLRAGHDENGKVIVQVIDNGPGIDSKHLDKIFLPFFTTKRNGSGVGLSVSRQIMFQNRGFISVRTAAGRGCEFTLKFR